ncbi:MAG: class I adenylate-forming enzyme family protein [Dethiobacteria bacterium]|jgi:long-chain acyl-CoA synthetase
MENYMKPAGLPVLEEKMTCRMLLHDRCSYYGAKPFLYDPMVKRGYSYDEFLEKVNGVSNLLWNQGIRPGDKVTIFMSNSPEYLWSYFGIIQLGAVIIPLNINLKTEEIGYILRNSDSVALFASEDCLQQAEQVLLAEKLDIILLAWDLPQGFSPKMGTGKLISPRPLLAREKTELRQEILDVPLAPDDVAQIMYTSGTTGRPKGAMLTHHNMIIDAHWIVARMGLKEADRAMCVMPLFHINGQIVTVMTPLYHGGSIVLPRRFSVRNFFKHIGDYGVTYTGTVATMLSMLLNKRTAEDRPEDSHLKIVFCGSAPVPREVQIKFETTFQVPVIEGYGMTETTCRSTFNLLPPPGKAVYGQDDGYRKIGSVGLPLGNEMRVVDETGKFLGPNERGEIIVRGENVMKGYYKNPGATEAAFVDGWFYTGDIGYFDEDGYFFIVDRKTDMIIRGGENIYPREIEEVLYRHKAVKDAACLGIPDELYGEEVAAFVALKDGEQSSEEELIALCRQHLAAFKCPKSIKILDEIPKSSSGKLLRRMLRET